MPSNDDGLESNSQHENDDNSNATSKDENAHPEGNVSDETDFDAIPDMDSVMNPESHDLPVNTTRRSSRTSRLPKSLNDFIIDGKVKYRVDKVVNYSKLTSDNYCITTSLNKSVEPTCYEEAILDQN